MPNPIAEKIDFISPSTFCTGCSLPVKERRPGRVRSILLLLLLLSVDASLSSASVSFASAVCLSWLSNCPIRGLSEGSTDLSWPKSAAISPFRTVYLRRKASRSAVEAIANSMISCCKLRMVFSIGNRV